MGEVCNSVIIIQNRALSVRRARMAVSSVYQAGAIIGVQHVEKWVQHTALWCSGVCAESGDVIVPTHTALHLSLRK